MLGFIFNFHPARVFMGDAGSLIRSIFCLLSINAINESYLLAPIWLQNINKPIFVMSILVYPLIDTLRVLLQIARVINSPFKADKNHIHHKFEKKWSVGHRRTALTLFFFSIVVVLFQLFIQIFLKIQSPTVLLLIQISFPLF